MYVGLLESADHSGSMRNGTTTLETEPQLGAQVKDSCWSAQLQLSGLHEPIQHSQCRLGQGQRRGAGQRVTHDRPRIACSVSTQCPLVAITAEIDPPAAARVYRRKQQTR